MSLKAKCKILYLTYPSPDYAKSKVRYSYDRVKAGTIGMLETITKEAEVSLIEEYGKRGYEYEASFLSRMSHLKDTPITGLPYPPWDREGLVLELLFTEGKGNIAYDTSGNENHGTVYGAVWKEEPLGGSLYFDGVDDYVELTSPIDVSLWNVCTVELLLRLTGTPEKITPIVNYYCNNNGFGIAVLTDRRVTWQSGPPSWSYVVSSAKVEEDWTYIAAIFEGASGNWGVKFFKNGTFVDEKSSTATFDYPILRYVGGYWYTGETVFKQEIAFVRIYNRALNESEIKSHYNWLVSQGVFG